MILAYLKKFAIYELKKMNLINKNDVIDSTIIKMEKVSLYFSSIRRTDQLPVRVFRVLHTLHANKKASFYKKRKKKIAYDTGGLY